MVLALLRTPAQYDAQQLKLAMKVHKKLHSLTDVDDIIEHIWAKCSDLTFIRYFLCWMTSTYFHVLFFVFYQEDKKACFSFKVWPVVRNNWCFYMCISVLGYGHRWGNLDRDFGFQNQQRDPGHKESLQGRFGANNTVKNLKTASDILNFHYKGILLLLRLYFFFPLRIQEGPGGWHQRGHQWRL